MGLIPAHRRAEGIGYWGMFTVFSTALGPTLGLWIYGFGWTWLCVWIGSLNLTMAAIAWRMQDDRETEGAAHGPWLSAGVVEWRVTALAFTLFLYCFGYGGITSFSALYADANGVSPRGLYFIVFATTILVTRPYVLRLADRVGHRRVLPPCLALVVAAYGLLAMAGSAIWLAVSAFLFGVGFGSAYPIFAAMITQHVSASRRGAAFGGILAALDTGIGSGSMAVGWVVERYGFRPAWAMAAALAVLAIPYFRFAEPRFLEREAPVA
jgi:MFS family permease